MRLRDNIKAADIIKAIVELDLRSVFIQIAKQNIFLVKWSGCGRCNNQRGMDNVSCR
jgi:hypothetical protein